MARIVEQVIVIKVSQLVKDSEENPIMLTDVDMQNLEAVLVEFAGEKALVEIETVVNQ